MPEEKPPPLIESDFPIRALSVEALLRELVQSEERFERELLGEALRIKLRSMEEGKR